MKGVLKRDSGVCTYRPRARGDGTGAGLLLLPESPPSPFSPRCPLPPGSPGHWQEQSALNLQRWEEPAELGQRLRPLTCVCSAGTK